MNIPFLDLKAQYQSISDEIDVALRQVVNAAAFSGGPFVERFEEQFARFCQTRHAIGVGSGTEALWLTLLALGVEPGDEVITVPNSFIATAEAISLCGAIPVFVDVDEQSFTMDPGLLEAAITRRTKVIIPVHLYGQTADMDPILAIAQKHRLHVVEDACQAHGAEYRGRKAGSIGIAGCFSFYPGKNLGAYGEAGGVTTNDNDLAARIRMLRDHGQSKKYSHAMIGVNSRMDGIQGAVLGVKLKYLALWNHKRARNAEKYCELLGGLDGLVLPRQMEYASHVYHIFAVRVEDREQFMKAMAEKGINCSIHYPVPIHLQDAYRFRQYRTGNFPVTEKLAEEIVSLPMYAELKDAQIEYTAEMIRKVLRHPPPQVATADLFA